MNKGGRGTGRDFWDIICQSGMEWGDVLVMWEKMKEITLLRKREDKVKELLMPWYYF